MTTVAVTGADGFIGSHLVENLVERGHRVRAMAQYNSLGTWGWLDALSPDVMANVEVLTGDVTDSDTVRDLITGAGTVYHLAALIAIPYSYRAPRSYVNTNVIGTLNVLEAVREQGCDRLVHTSTSETYGTAMTVPISETHPVQAQSPYAASKAGADKLVDSYHASFDTPTVIMRPFNTFGPRQSARAVIPTVISQLAAGADEIRLGALDPTRDFLFVHDTAEAFATVGTAPAEKVVGQSFNAGTGDEISIGKLAEMICALMGRPVPVRLENERLRPTNSEVMRLVCDSSKLRAATGWAPAHDLASGLKLTIDWFLDPANLAKYRPGTYAR
ncbi:NAD-dependent dehydratase [Actinoplanes sp. SE50]|uniref:SDR family NAD(P)-dependent oxidoreductase n=1 Tax=unclassified Actinoplanes TaxID=2626549 RepID=UPI00023EBE42|nr:MULTISPECIES: SDR family NAD(P)-dependent oxidoreductase [unclassified Actinoplanes]AEV81250.1 NAD-dependent epimerase/dehydratase [Actinoplanes sp. SE50/110]ATO79653.1 NAD-dependent dehydratase [Actinoplanes sp. SE50]SLL97056.1 NAD-dependent dehydratase [Actinoplanes sp. SE50/110]